MNVSPCAGVLLATWNATAAVTPATQRSLKMNMQHHTEAARRRPILLPPVQSGGDQEDPPAPPAKPPVALDRLQVYVLPWWLLAGIVFAAGCPFLAFILAMWWMQQ